MNQPNVAVSQDWVVAPAPVEFVVAPVEGPWASFSRFLAGFQLYTKFQPVEACQNEDERRGWLSALDSEADAGMPRYNAYGDIVLGC